MSKFSHSPFKTLYYVLLMIAVGAGIILVVFAFSWLINNIYTLIWVFLLLGCLIWLGDSVLHTIKNDSDPSDNHQFPSDTFKG